MTDVDTQNAKKALLVVATGLPIVFLCTLVHSFGVNVPFWDDWEMVPLFQKYDAGNLTLSDLLAQHNEHRIFFPRMTFYISIADDVPSSK